MSLAAIIPTGVGAAQGLVTSASIIQNILAGLSPSIAGLDAIATLAKDIGGFEFDYIGDEDVEGNVDITDDYAEDNTFIQDHRAVKPQIVTFRGFAAEVAFNKSSLLPTLAALSTALTPVTPYLGTYSPGAAAAMTGVVSQTQSVINQLAQIQSLYNSASKLFNPFAPTKVQQAFTKLTALKNSQTTFAVVTPWAVFGDLPSNGNGPMLIESLRMRSPEETRGWADIVVRLKEIRVAPSLVVTTQDNARGSQVSTYNGTASAASQ